MEQMHFRGWLIEYDSQATREAFQGVEAGDSERCTCAPCVNFLRVRQEGYPPEFRELLDRLGVNWMRDADVHHIGPVHDGLHAFGGWFHFVGRVDGPDQAVELTDGFRVRFHGRPKAVPPSFEGKEIAQVDFETRIPWVIEAPAPVPA